MRNASAIAKEYLDKFKAIPEEYRRNNSGIPKEASRIKNMEGILKKYLKNT